MAGLEKLPVIGGFFDDSDDRAMDELRRNQELWGELEVPEHQWTDYDPEMYLYGGDVQAERISEDPLLRSAQLSALEKMSGLATDGLALEDQAAFEKARDIGNQVARGGTQAALANAQARGVGGSGLEFAMREIASQEGAKRSQDAGLNQAATSARNRVLYNQAYGNEASRVRGDDYRTKAANADVINRFNQANTTRRENVQNRNVDQRNDRQQINQRGRTDTAQRNFDNQVTKIGGQTGANTGAASGWAARNAENQSDRNANTDLLSKIWLGA